MPAYRRRIAGAAAVALVFCFAGCHSQSVSDEPQYIMLTYNGGNCQQNGSPGVIDVSKGQAVIYQGASLLRNFQVGLSSCPFVAGNCPVKSPNGDSINVGKPNSGTDGSTFMYNNLNIDGEPCTNAAQMGVRVKP